MGTGSPRFNHYLLRRSIPMKVFMNVLAVCCLLVVVGCSSSDDVAPAAMAECGADCSAACCAEKASCCKEGGAMCDDCKAKMKSSLGAVGDAPACCKSTATDASPGAVTDAPSCCKGKATVSPAAVSDSNCASKCSTASSCTKTDASPGAISDSNCASKCSSAKSSCTKTDS